MKKQKRVVALHDISCFGKCSLTVAMPIISAAGCTVSIVPTAVLSTHTGGFTDFTFRDLTEDILPIADHWQSLNLDFDAIYTGFLGSLEQIDIMCDFFSRFKNDNNLLLVDPVMADDGNLYSIFDDNFPKEMKKLCHLADVIVPNITEASFLLDEEYIKGPYTYEYIEDLLKKLGTIGAKKIVLTGVYFDNEKLGVATYDVLTEQIQYVFSDKIDGMYHGTGDVFGSALLSALLNDFSLTESAQIAVDFTVGSIKRTKEEKTDIRFGVNFEQGIPALIEKLNLN